LQAEVQFLAQALADGRRTHLEALLLQFLADLVQTLLPLGRQRRPGGGRKAKAETEAGLMKAIEEIVDPVTRGDPMRPLRWTSMALALPPSFLLSTLGCRQSLLAD
jgi:hypothetical protein